jgi:hypothetical protein
MEINTLRHVIKFIGETAFNDLTAHARYWTMTSWLIAAVYAKTVVPAVIYDISI